MAAGGCQTARPRAGGCLEAAESCPLFSENWSGALGRLEPLAPLTTLKVGGPAAVTARPADLEQLRQLLAILKRWHCPWRVLGRGSNLLVADRGYAGVAVVLDHHLAGIELLPVKTVALGRGPRSPVAADLAAAGHMDVQEADATAIDGLEAGRMPAENEPLPGFAAPTPVPQPAVLAASRPPSRLVRVEAGRSLASLLNWTVAQGLGGLEFLAGIPGSVGGAAMMNAGAFGQCFGERVVALELVSAAGLSKVAPGEGLHFSYRRLQGMAPEEIIGAVTLALEPKPPEEIKKTARHYVAKRRAGQPRGVASAGSFFKNPPGDYAGRLIEAAGLKGLRIGRAEVSPRHANFLVNRGGARAADLLALARQVQAKVLEHSGVKLEFEVHLLENVCAAENR